MRVMIWVSDWQIECCGEPFAVGDRVSWDVRDPDMDWLKATVGDEIASSITHSMERHEYEDVLSELTGTVVAIKRAWGDFAQLKPNDTCHYPVPGSQRLLDVRESYGAEQDAFPELTFNGWVVELRVAA
ncbi:DUF6578 domain-containing protein [Nocardioides sp. CCNWLW239]|uniref:DUF6578 domain-containing protein n=1 Tax=Nocardioides sp. CCNWLW239 TaxID=3128902 RepID=UPI003017CE10